MTRRPASGPNLFPSMTGDERPITLVPAISLTGERVYLVCRFPQITSRPWSDKPIVSETIRMSEKPRITRPLSPDPYKTLPLESDLPKPEPMVEKEVA